MAGKTIRSCSTVKPWWIHPWSVVTHCWSVSRCFQMDLNKCSIGPLMRVSLSGCLVLGGGWRKGIGRRWRNFPLHQQSSGPFGRHVAILSVTPKTPRGGVSLIQSCGCLACFDNSICSMLIRWGPQNQSCFSEEAITPLKWCSLPFLDTRNAPQWLFHDMFQ